MRIYDLSPTDGRKSFYGKAKVYIMENGDSVLYSYNIRILTLTAAGEIRKHWNGWTQTTGRHIAAFTGLNKKQFEALKMEK